MKTSLYCLAIAMVFHALIAQTVQTPVQKQPRQIVFRDKIRGIWLVIERNNDTTYDDPNQTTIWLQKTLVATARLHADGRREIQFRSEIAKGLP